MDVGTADEPSESTYTAKIADAVQNNATSSLTPRIPELLANDIVLPRMRPSMQKTFPNSVSGASPQGSQPSSTPAKQSSRRSPSKGPRRSTDGRPLIRSTKISVRMKPRSTAATITTHGPSVVESLAQALPSPAPRMGTSPSPRKSASSARRISSSSPRNHSTSHSTQIYDNESAKSDRLGSLKVAGCLRPRYSVSYRLGRPPRNVPTSANSETPSPSSRPVSPTPTPAEAQLRDAAPIIKDAADLEKGAKDSVKSLQEEPQAQPHTQDNETQRLARAWHEVKVRERQLEEREDALRLGLKRLKQDRETFEKEKRHFYEGQQQQRRAAREEESRRKGTAKRSRSGSKPRSKVVPDDSWRHNQHGGKDKEKHRDTDDQQQQDRHTSWSSINSTTSPSPSTYPSDAESSTTAATSTHSKSTASSTRITNPPPETNLTNQIPPFCTWASPPTHIAASYARYNDVWMHLGARSPQIPYPSPDHTPAALHQTSHLPLTARDTWSPDAAVKYNAIAFFLSAHGVPVAPDVRLARPKVGLGGIGDARLRGLVRGVRGELRRWHEDGLKYRSEGGEGAVNEALVRDETARAVFRAFTELRDGLLAEVRCRRENGVEGKGMMDAAAAATEVEREEGGVEQGKAGDTVEMDWTVLSEAIL